MKFEKLDRLIQEIIGLNNELIEYDKNYVPSAASESDREELISQYQAKRYQLNRLLVELSVGGTIIIDDAGTWTCQVDRDGVSKAEMDMIKTVLDKGIFALEKAKDPTVASPNISDTDKPTIAPKALDKLLTDVDILGCKVNAADMAVLWSLGQKLRRWKRRRLALGIVVGTIVLAGVGVGVATVVKKKRAELDCDDSDIDAIDDAPATPAIEAGDPDDIDLEATEGTDLEP